jgi:2-polyprenyl-3-methyl-5-hydroxy-6-metoxy-1,4-benzoquinol methylase
MERNTRHRASVESGERFRFGANWLRFSQTLDAKKIESAEASMREMLGDLRGRSFLDVGCGSGLSALAAHRLGAKVRAFDYDPQSVECTRELERRYGADWHVDEGSALDADYLRGLGQYDVVYSWGVLHHTGDMWRALGNMVGLVKADGKLFVAIYNDQGRRSRFWHAIKKAYNRNVVARWTILLIYAPAITVARFIVRAVRGNLELERGMTIWHDAVDWLGGYPFEVASANAIEKFYTDRGFIINRKIDVGNRMGCNELVFSRAPPERT